MFAVRVVNAASVRFYVGAIVSCPKRVIFLLPTLPLISQNIPHIKAVHVSISITLSCLVCFSKGRNVLVNLIPYNPTYAPGSEEFQEPTEEALQKFRTIVHEHGLLVTIRR